MNLDFIKSSNDEQTLRLSKALNDICDIDLINSSIEALNNRINTNSRAVDKLFISQLLAIMLYVLIVNNAVSVDNLKFIKITDNRIVVILFPALILLLNRIYNDRIYQYIKDSKTYNILSMLRSNGHYENKFHLFSIDRLYFEFVVNITPFVKSKFINAVSRTSYIFATNIFISIITLRILYDVPPINGHDSFVFIICYAAMAIYFNAMLVLRLKNYLNYFYY